MPYNNRLFLYQQTYATLFAALNKLQVAGDSSLTYLTSRQLMLLITIEHLEPGTASVKNISKMMGATKQSTKQIVDILKNKNYIIANTNPADKRSVDLSLTREGKQVLQHDYACGMQMFEEFFRDFTTEELNQFWEYLQRLYRYDGEKQIGYEKTNTTK